MLARKWIRAEDFKGYPKVSDFNLIDETLPTELNVGEILAKAEWISVDPYMRVFSCKRGEQMFAGQVARVVRSKCAIYPEGSKVVASFGWRDTTIFKSNPKGDPGGFSLRRVTIYPMPDLKGLPDSYALGAVGMPGNTAYFGFLDICQPKAGETVVVSGAGGAVGSLVGQIAKIKGCKVLAFAGNPEKLKWMREVLQFDHVFDYKAVDLDQTFGQHAPDGIDSYFDNVGADFTNHVIKHMKEGGRIAQCGSMSTFNQGQREVPLDQAAIRAKHIRLVGVNVSSCGARWNEGLNQMRDWILEGRIKVRETVTEGFENMPKAFIEMLHGNNVGKQIVKV